MRHFVVVDLERHKHAGRRVANVFTPMPSHAYTHIHSPSNAHSHTNTNSHTFALGTSRLYGRTAAAHSLESKHTHAHTRRNNSRAARTLLSYKHTHTHNRHIPVLYVWVYHWGNTHIHMHCSQIKIYTSLSKYFVGRGREFVRSVWVCGRHVTE